MYLYGKNEHHYLVKNVDKKKSDRMNTIHMLKKIYSCVVFIHRDHGQIDVLCLRFISIQARKCYTFGAYEHSSFC